MRHIHILNKDGKVIHTIHGGAVAHLMNSIIGQHIPKKDRQNLHIRYGKKGEHIPMHHEKPTVKHINEYIKAHLLNGKGAFSGTIEGEIYDEAVIHPKENSDEELILVEEKGKGKKSHRKAYEKELAMKGAEEISPSLAIKALSLGGTKPNEASPGTMQKNSIITKKKKPQKSSMTVEGTGLNPVKDHHLNILYPKSSPSSLY
jgi:hypothetical protein